MLTLGDGERALDAEFSPNGETIATANVDGSAAIWDARSGERIGAPLQDTDRGAFITRVTFVPRGDAVVTGGGDVTAWDLLSRDQIEHYRGHGGLMLDVEAPGDGKRLVTAGSDGTARVWDVGARTATIQSGAIVTPQFSPDGERLLYADGLAEIADPADGRPIARISGHSAVFGTAFNPDGTRFAAAEADGRAEIFDASTGKRVGPTFDHGDANGIFAAQWSADGSRLMTAGDRSGVKVWDAASGELIATLPLPPEALFLFGAALSPDGSRVAVIEVGHEAEVRAVANGTTVATLSGHTDRLTAISYDRAGNRILTASEDGTARIWDAATGRQLQLLNNDGNPIRSAAFNADASLVATAGPNAELRVWEAGSGLELSRFSGADDGLAFSPDSRLIVGVDTVTGQATVYECEVCEADLDQLEQLAEQRITRDPTAQERDQHLDR